MNTHKNARLTPYSREELVRRVLREGTTVRDAAAADAAIAAARAEVKRMELDITRTVITAPFEAFSKPTVPKPARCCSPGRSAPPSSISIRRGSSVSYPSGSSTPSPSEPPPARRLPRATRWPETSPLWPGPPSPAPAPSALRSPASRPDWKMPNSWEKHPQPSWSTTRDKLRDTLQRREDIAGSLEQIPQSQPEMRENSC